MARHHRRPFQLNRLTLWSSCTSVYNCSTTSLRGKLAATWNHGHPCPFWKCTSVYTFSRHTSVYVGKRRVLYKTRFWLISRPSLGVLTTSFCAAKTRVQKLTRKSIFELGTDAKMAKEMKKKSQICIKCLFYHALHIPPISSKRQCCV